MRVTHTVTESFALTEKREERVVIPFQLSLQHFGVHLYAQILPISEQDTFAFTTPQRRREVATETFWLPKPEIFITCLCTEKVHTTPDLIKSSCYIDEQVEPQRRVQENK